MKHLFIAITVVSFFSCKKSSSDTTVPPVTADSFRVSVNNGYGGGKYKIGDTVHIFSIAYTDNQAFDKWSSSDAGLLNAFEEWHTWFIMPVKDVAFTGSIKPLHRLLYNTN